MRNNFLDSLLFRNFIRMMVGPTTTPNYVKFLVCNRCDCVEELPQMWTTIRKFLES